MITANNMDKETIDKLLEKHVDIKGAFGVEVSISRNKRTLHVNVNDVCILRIQDISFLNVDRKGG